MSVTKTTTSLKQEKSLPPPIHHNGGDLEQMGGDDDDADNPMIPLPKEVLRRVNALKNIQLKMVNKETEFYEELHLLECKYAKIYEELYESRKKIVNGEYEPTDEEAKFALDAADELANELKDKANLDEDKKNDAAEEPVKGNRAGFTIQANES